MATACDVTLLLLGLFTVSCGLEIQQLDQEWIVKEATGKYDNLKATVPGGIYTDLMNNKIIGDVFYGSNDTETRWVAESDWTYSCQFSVNETFLSYKTINVVFEGLDTFATVLLNDVEIGTSQNMFVRYIFDIKPALQAGNNTLEIRFVSPIKIAEELASKQGYTVPPECPPAESKGVCHANQIRKMQASFSWDWGPALPSMGIWKEMYVEGFNSSVIRYLVVDHKEAPNDSWQISISTYLSAKQGEIVQGKLLYGLETDVSIIQEIVDVNHTNTGDNNEVKVDFSFTIPKITVRKWWPNGYGEHKLYTLTADFQSGSERSSKSIRIGFRKIELIQDPIGTGLSFYFKVNDVPIFAKGANEIPLDILPERGYSSEKISRLLESAYATNMNMLRVWGGGVYESDTFYETTDMLGILIWQDFMFACAMYPTYPEFLSNVKEELRHQIRRLSSHPSIALWAANNENELALVTNWYGTQRNFSLYKDDYIKLYIDTIKPELDELTNDVIFVSSSPSNGKETVEEGYLATNPIDPLYGDVHYYNYLLNSVDPSIYLIPRFASEYGYQSLPDEDAWFTATDNVTDLYPDSDFMDHRQHHPLGLFENNLLINYQLNLIDPSTPDYYKIYIFYTQILQAMSIKFESEYYRSFMGRVDSIGRGNTMGALFWQLNDVWVAPTWSGIDFTGKWKMMQYFAKDFFAPTIITGYLDVSRQLKIYAVSEVVSLFGSSLNASVLVEVYNWTSFNPINSTQIEVTLEYGKSLEVTSIDTDIYLNSIGCGSLTVARSNCFFYLTLSSVGAVIAPQNLILATALKNSHLQKTKLEISSIKEVNPTKFEITLQTDGITLFVWLDAHQIRGTFSENGFAQIVPNKTVTFQVEEFLDIGILQETLTVTYLNNPQYQ